VNGDSVSEYQYYEFRAVDRPLSKTEQRELRAAKRQLLLRLVAAGLD
jgi:hypothetical protein